MIYTLAIYGAPYSSQAPATALAFAKALLGAGHNINRLFFYMDGVYTANELASPPQDETNLSTDWQAFISAHQLDAVVCIAAAARRGVLDTNEAGRYEKSAANLAEGFSLSGLGQLIEASVTADRFITFGA